MTGVSDQTFILNIFFSALTYEIIPSITCFILPLHAEKYEKKTKMFFFFWYLINLSIIICNKISMPICTEVSLIIMLWFQILGELGGNQSDGAINWRLIGWSTAVTCKRLPKHLSKSASVLIFTAANKYYVTFLNLEKKTCSKAFQDKREGN